MCVTVLIKFDITVFAALCYASAAYVVMQCPSIMSMCVSVTFVDSVKMNKHIFKIFSPLGSQAILVFLCQTAWQYSDENPPNGGVECKWGRQKSRFWAYIWLHCVLSTLQLASCYQHDATEPRSHKLTLIAGSKRQSLLLAGNDDEMFMTRNLNVTPTDNRIAFNCTQW